jgi:hypothetical protein
MIATTAPMGPVLAVIDADQQEEELEPGRKLFIPKLRTRSADRRSQCAGRSGEAARGGGGIPSSSRGAIRAARSRPKAPRTIGRAAAGAVVDERNRMNMPSRHPLNHTQRGAAAIRQADVIPRARADGPLRHAEQCR